MSRVQVKWHGGQVKRRARDGLTRGLHLAAEHVLEEARRIVPHEEGTLERSGSTDVDGDRASVFFDTPYAVVQHERLDYAHDAGRRAKYLETPMGTERDVIARLIAREIRAKLGGGVL